MHAHPHFRSCRAGRGGFTLVELMIAVIVVGLLAAIALPSFMDAIRKSRRADAFDGIARVQQAQERWRGSHASYATALSDPDIPANALGLNSVTAARYYTLSLSSVTASTYTVTAAANTDTSQASDGNCKMLAVKAEGGNLKYGSGASAIDWTDATRCWAR